MIIDILIRFHVNQKYIGLNKIRCIRESPDIWLPFKELRDKYYGN